MKKFDNSVIYQSLKDKVVLISGGASGIGSAFIEAFLYQGAKVAFLDIDTENAEKLVHKFTEFKARLYFQRCDIQDIPLLKQCIANVETHFGTVDVLINNVANDLRHHYLDVTSEDWDKSIAINIKHYFFSIQSVVEGMKQKGGGSIINIGSTSWMQGISDLVLYTTAKSALHGMTRSLARALGGDNIRVNNLIPGAIKTPKQDEMWANEADGLAVQNQEFLDKQMIKRRLIPEDCARLALFLASSESEGCTAQDFIVDAGLLYQE